MSYVVVTCPWCDATYEFGLVMVGGELVGSGHICEATKACETPGCAGVGRFQVADRIGPDETGGESFVCAEHIGGRVIMACQPGGER